MNKKKQKTFWARAVSAPQAQLSKSFLRRFFQKSGCSSVLTKTDRCSRASRSLTLTELRMASAIDFMPLASNVGPP